NLRTRFRKRGADSAFRLRMAVSGATGRPRAPVDAPADAPSRRALRLARRVHPRLAVEARNCYLRRPSVKRHTSTRITGLSDGRAQGVLELDVSRGRRITRAGCG